MDGEIIDSTGTTVGMAASGDVENGEIVNSVAAGVMIVAVVNGMNAAAAGNMDAAAIMVAVVSMAAVTVNVVVITAGMVAK